MSLSVSLKMMVLNVALNMDSRKDFLGVRNEIKERRHKICIKHILLSLRYLTDLMDLVVDSPDGCSC